MVISRQIIVGSLHSFPGSLQVYQHNVCRAHTGHPLFDRVLIFSGFSDTYKAEAEILSNGPR